MFIPCILLTVAILLVALLVLIISPYFAQKWEITTGQFFRAIFDYRLWRCSNWYAWDKERFANWFSITGTMHLALKWVIRDTLVKTGNTDKAHLFHNALFV